MRLYVLLILLACSTSSFARQRSDSASLLRGVYILVQMEKDGFLLDYDDTAGTIKRAIKRHMQEKNLKSLSASDSLELAKKYRDNLARTASISRFIVTFNAHGTFHWKAVSGQRDMIFSGTYVLNTAKKEIVLTRYEDLKKNDTYKIHLKLLSMTANELVVQIEPGRNEDGKLTLRKKHL